MAKHRFYLPASEWNLEHLVLSGEEAHHCLDVMRCREGDRIIASQGQPPGARKRRMMRRSRSSGGRSGEGIS